MLEWIGDVGGLFDGLFIFVKFLMTPIYIMTLREAFLTLAPSDTDLDIKSKGPWTCCSRKDRYRDKALYKIEKLFTK